MSDRQRADDGSINIFDLIDSICSEFRGHWKAGNRPRIEDYLPRVPVDARSNLFRNLLQLDVRYRSHAGERVRSGEYLQRFPEFKRLVRLALDEPSMMSIEGAQKEPADVAHALNVTIEAPAANRIGDYELIRELGRGGMGVVYEARHTETGNRVALKTLPSGTDGQQVNANKLHRFRKEFRSLSEVNHPNLVGMQTLEVDAGQWFFTMDLIEGEDFLTYVRPDDRLDEARLQACIPQLARGIMALHRRGIVHRDLKPSNVLVSKDGRVLILDFGLVAEMQQSTDRTQTRSAMFVGTPPYAAPEQLGGKRTAANDWYAFGTMLYEALVGTVPFRGENPLEVLQRKQQEKPPTLTGRDDVPHDVAKLVDGLIAKDPRSRLNAETISERLKLDDETRTQGSTLGSRGQGSSGSVEDEEVDVDALQDEEIVLIGREEQLSQLEAAKHELLANRNAAVVFITGLSGEGKSSLAEKFLRPHRHAADILILSGRCYDRESVPFKVIDSQIEALVAFLRSRSEPEVESWLPGDIELLARLFPLLRRVRAIDRRVGIVKASFDERRIRNLAFAAFKELLFAISQSTPIIMFIDDLQWGDADSAEVLPSILSPPCAPALILLGSFRSDEMDESPFWAGWRHRAEGIGETLQTRTVRVRPLSEAECFQLVQERLGAEDSEAVRTQASTLFSDTRGNPYFLEQFLEGYDTSSASFDPIPLPEMIDARLGRCPIGAKPLLQAIAVSGKAIAVSELALTVGQVENALSTITHMRSERLVRLVGSHQEQTVDTYHDKIRETLISQMSVETRCSWHRRFADAIESNISRTTVASTSEQDATNTDRVSDLAHHCYEANDPRAFQYQLQAGRKSLASYGMQNSLEHFQKAEEFIPSDIDAQTRFQLKFMLAEAHAGCDQLDRAVDAYVEASSLATSSVERSSCMYQLAEVHWKQSNFGEGLKCINESLIELGESLPQSTFSCLCRIIGSLFKHHCLPNWAFWHQRKRPSSEHFKLSQMYGLLNWKLTHLDPLLYFYVTVRSCLFARLSNDARAKHEAYSLYAAMLSFVGMSFASRWVLNASTNYAKLLSEEQLSGTTDANLGVLYYCLGQHDNAETYLNAAAPRLERTSHYYRTFVQHFLWHVSTIRGQSSAIVHHAGIEASIANTSDDKIMLAYGQYGLAQGLAIQGETTKAKELAEASRSYLGSIGATMNCVANAQMARVLIQKGDYEGARHASTAAIREIPKFRFFEISSPAFSIFVESVLAITWIQTRTSISLSDRYKAMFSVVASRFVGFLFPNNRPHALRMQARLATAKGRSRKAIRYFDKAIKSASEIGAEYEHARTLIDKSMLDYPESMDDRQRGLDLLESLGCVLPDAEVEYLSIDHDAHHARAAAARDKQEAELESRYSTANSVIVAN